LATADVGLRVRIAFFFVPSSDIEARLAALEKERAASKEGTQFA
jgi:hypothetical protein